MRENSFTHQKNTIMEKHQKSMTKTSRHTNNNKKSKVSEETHSMLLALFTSQVKDIYWAEKLLVKTLPKMQKAATSSEVKNAFADHLEQTKTHVTRLEQVFDLLGEKALAKKCEAMEGITKEGETIIEETKEDTATRDAGLILAAQKVEHYEIATYGGLVQLSRTMEMNGITALLENILAEEKEADMLLTDIAEDKVNCESMEEMEA